MKLSDFYGSLGAQRPFPGKQAIREEVGRDLGERVKRFGESRNSTLNRDDLGVQSSLDQF